MEGQADIIRLVFGFVDSMALKSAVELHIPDIIHSHSQPITLSQIASSIDIDRDDHHTDAACLSRILRLLVRRRIFTASDGHDGEKLYGPTELSKWLLLDSDTTLAPWLLMQSHPTLLAPWHCLSRCVREGGDAFEKAHGKPIFEFGSGDAEFNKILNDAMECMTKIDVETVVEEYGDVGFGGAGTVVDVGGGTGSAVAGIVRAYPDVKGVNFDLPHVVATAPRYHGVSHVGGDMFEAIPKADVVFMKFVMHDWDDEKCVKILKNCRRSIPEKTGKIVIMDIVLKPDGNGEHDDMGLLFDLVMIAHASGGKERTEVEWNKLLEEGGFPRHNIINIPSFLSIIEAYPI